MRHIEIQPWFGVSVSLVTSVGTVVHYVGCAWQNAPLILAGFIAIVLGGLGVLSMGLVFARDMWWHRQRRRARKEARS